MSASRGKNIKQPDALELARTLSRWFSRRGRPMPWRETRDPYQIWLSEVILQQTQVSRGAEYYESFLEAYPELRDLAASSERKLLRLWEGLGYYRRAGNLLKAAKILVKEHGAVFPESRAELEALPGVGRYTASAILSFAFEHSCPAVDTNIRRVGERVFGAKDWERQLEEMFTRTRVSSRRLNYALMDLGSELCKARSADCQSCSLKNVCKSAFKIQDELATLQKKRAKKEPASRLPRVAVACCYKGGDYYVKRGGELPAFELRKGEGSRERLKEEFRQLYSVTLSVRPAFMKLELEGKQYQFCRCRSLDGEPRKLNARRLESLSRLPDALFERLKAFPISK